MKKLLILLFVLQGSIFTLQSCSDDDDDDMMRSQEFVTEAGSSNRLEIDAANLAKQKSDNSQIEAYADHMIMDHTMATAELVAVAKANDLTLTEMPPMNQKHQAKYNELAAITDVNAFEKAYAKMMVESHGEAIDLFQYGAGHADKEAIREFAAGKLDKLHEHLEGAQNLNKTFNP